MLRVYEAWQDPVGFGVTLALATGVDELRAKKLLDRDAKLLYRIEAHSHEEAAAIHHVRMGWQPYQPVGESGPCPHCGAQIYPEGSGECWQCGKIS